jgi:hypothetical protein
MPKLRWMAQISRPFQIVLVAVLALAMVVVAWFMVLHRPGSEPATGGSSPSVASSAGGASAHPAAAKGSASAAGSGHIYHGSAPGVEGLTRDIKRAHEAAAKEERGVAHPQNGVTHASAAVTAAAAHTAAPTRASTKPHTSVAAAKHGVVPAKHGVVPAKHGVVPVKQGVGHGQGTKTHVSHATEATGTTAASILHHLTTAEHLSFVVNLLEPALKAELVKDEDIFISSMKSYLKPASQATVAAELHHGKTVLLLFLNPSSYDDDATAIETVAAAHDLGHTVSVHFALANQVNSFGSITQAIQVYQTPTLLIVTPKRQVTTLTGLTDDYSIKQAVAEARG